MKSIVIIALFNLLSLIISAQHTFFKIVRTNEFERGFDALQCQNGDFIIVGERSMDDTYEKVKGLACLVDPSGIVIRELELSPDTVKRTWITIVLQNSLHNDQLLLIGSLDSYFQEDPNSRFIIYTSDNELNILDYQSYDSLENHLMHAWKSVLVNDSVLYILIDDHPLENPATLPQTGVSKIILATNSIMNFFTQPSVSIPRIAQDILYLPDRDVLEIFYIGDFDDKSNTWLRILEMDLDLNVNDTVDGPPKIYSTVCAVNRDTNTYILTATGDPPDPVYQEQRILTFIMDSFNDTLKRTIIHTDPDTILYAGGGTNTAITGQSVFITGVKNINPSTFPFQTTPTWIQITKCDLDLNVISEHFYGGDAQYFPYSIIATQDGGVFITGFVWEYDIPDNYQWDLFYLKTDSTGSMLSIQEENIQKIHDAILCPNPGSDYCIAIVSVQHPEATLFLYDMNGKQIMEQELYQHQTRINTSSLPAGTYVYKFMANGKVIGSGKWVKR